MTVRFPPEVWIEYGIGVLVLLLRYFTRWKTVGFKGWEGDDYLALVVFVCWTCMIGFLDVFGQRGTVADLTEEISASLTNEQIVRYELGSKFFLAGRVSYVTMVWALKGCLLFFYNRIVRGLQQQALVKWSAVVCFCSYIAAMATVWGHCWPAYKNWQAKPYPGDECAYSRVYYIILVALNVSTDILIVTIPFKWLPILRVTFWHKVAIGLLLCSGFFVITAAIVRSVLTLCNIQSMTNKVMWAIREMFVAIIAVNAAVIKPLFSRKLWITLPTAQNQGNCSVESV